MPDPRQNDDVFGERLGRVLRAPERFRDRFERELVDAIRHDHPIERVEPRARTLGPTWWRTPVPLRLSPLAGFALAASVAALAILGGGLVARPRADAPSIAGKGARPFVQVVHDTVHVVRFVFVGDAKSVSLVGDFNAWRTEATPLALSGNTRAWTVSLTLPRGRYEYAFIVDGKQWVADPFAPASADEFDTRSSIVMVGS